jgi:hypothetical protein
MNESVPTYMYLRPKHALKLRDDMIDKIALPCHRYVRFAAPDYVLMAPVSVFAGLPGPRSQVNSSDIAGACQNVREV